VSWWRPSYAWAACRGKYGGESDGETLARAAEAGDVACINALLDKYPAVVVLHDSPDRIYTSLSILYLRCAPSPLSQK